MARRVPTDLTMLARLYEIWEPQEDARRQISEDLKELFAEAKGNGYNPKALRKAFAERYRLDHQTDEQALKANQTDEDTELYLSALARVRESDTDTQSTAARMDAQAQPTGAAKSAELRALAPAPSTIEASGSSPAGTQAPPVDTLHPQPASLAGLPGATAPGERIKEPAHFDLSEVGAVGEGGRAALAVAAEPGGEGPGATKGALSATNLLRMPAPKPQFVQVPHHGDVA